MKSILESEYIAFNDVINNLDTSSISRTDDLENILPTVNIYQVQGQCGKKGAIIKYLGKNIYTPTISIYEFNFKTYKCEILSYLLDDNYIENVNDTCCLKMMELIIKDNNNISAIINMSFYTFTHKKNKSNIKDYISTTTNINLIGFYQHELNYKEKCMKIGDIFEIFPGKTKCIYNLLSLLSSDKLSFLFE